MDTSIISGPGRQLVALIPELQRSGVRLEVVCFAHVERMTTDYIRFLEAHGLPHHVVPTRGRIDRVLIADVVALLKREQPDLVQSHSYRPAALAALARAHGLRSPWIGFFHGDTREDLRVRLYNAVHWGLLHLADHVVVVSPHQRARFRFRSALTYIPNAVIPADGTVEATFAEPIGDVPRPRIGFIGRLSAEKGWRVLLQAFPEVVATFPEAMLVVAGDGPDASAFDAEVIRRGIGTRVVRLGQVPDAGAVYPLLDVLVLPSLTEGMPNVVLEALRHDVPVVASRVGAVPELLADPATGMLVDAGDPAQLARSLVRAVRIGRTDAGSAARARAAAGYALPDRAARHLALYTQVLAQQLTR
jgi:glycosyltransferase involved in cell wall biosynthesis